MLENGGSECIRQLTSPIGGVGWGGDENKEEEEEMKAN